MLVFLTPVNRLIREGNQAQQWLKKYEQGISISTIIEDAIASVYQEEKELEDKLCEPILVA